ncbi:MAG: GYD domain-containing protein [Pseudomonadales bacterium]
MPTYLMLSTLTDEGRRTLKDNPERLDAVNEEIRAMGALVRSQYAVLGGYDFVNVIEAPSNEVVANISHELESRGTIRVTALPAMAVNEFVLMMCARNTDADSGG